MYREHGIREPGTPHPGTEVTPLSHLALVFIRNAHYGNNPLKAGNFVLKLAFASPARFLAALLTAGCLCGGAHAENQAPVLNASTQPSASPNPTGTEAAKLDPNTAFLAKASQLYYSSSKAGLKGFDCQVHPDWHSLFVSAEQDPSVADNDPRIQLLKSVNITLHGRLTGGSSLDWNLPTAHAKPLNQDLIDLLDSMHQASDRTLTGFMQFWSPFINGSVIPATPDGLEITHSDKGHTLHADQEGTSLTEVLDSNLVMQQFNVATGGAKIDFSPRYKFTGQGLLVNGFQARIQAPSDPPDQAEQMRVDIDYQTVSGYPIPSKISMEVLGTGKSDFTLDGCTVNPPAS
jgi:hypothetical protein